MDQFIYWLRCQLLLDEISVCFTFWWLCGYFHVRNQKLKADWRISYFDRSIHLLVRCCQLGPTRCRKLHKRKLKCSRLEMFQVELLFIISGPTIVTSSYKGRPWVIKKSLNDDAPVWISHAEVRHANAHWKIWMGLSCNSSSVGMNFLHSFMSGLPQPAC